MMTDVCDNPERPHFYFTFKKKTFSVPYEDILFFETGRSHSVVLHTTEAIFSFSGSLSNISDALSVSDGFLPIGRSFLINLNHVAGQINKDLKMSDGSTVQIPVRRRTQILNTVAKRMKQNQENCSEMFYSKKGNDT